MVMPNQAAAEGAGTEGGRRPTVVPAPSTANPEISDRPRRRTFTATQKLHILKEADQAAGSGEIGAILRRHGFYSSARKCAAAATPRPRRGDHRTPKKLADLLGLELPPIPPQIGPSNAA